GSTDLYQRKHSIECSQLRQRRGSEPRCFQQRRRRARALKTHRTINWIYTSTYKDKKELAIMSEIKYQFGAISNAAPDINSTSSRINGLLDDLKGVIAPMAATWEGESAAAYNEAQAKWDKAAAELNTVLATISNTVSQSNDRMSDVNRRAAASWG